jgi:YesN/AraC family two-component response regulator
MSYEENLSQLISKLIIINKTINSNFNIPIFYYIGNTYDSISNISSSYNEAKQAEIYKYLYPEKQLIYYKDINKSDNIDSNFHEKIYKDISSNIKQNNITELKKIIYETIILIKKEMYSYDFTIKCLKKIINTIEFTLTQINYDLNDMVPYNISDYFEKINNINDFEVWIDNIFNTVYEKLNEKNTYKDTEYIQSIKKFVLKNIEEDICLKTVSENLYISPYYLSRIFKKETNIGFNEYVTQCKMEKAKEYLIESNIKIDDISKKLGYKNTSYFIKKFKESFGKSPNQYRYEKTVK